MSCIESTLRANGTVFNPPRPKPVQKTRSFATTSPFIPVVSERITRDWLRGVSELSLSKMYGRTREAIEQTVREQVSQMLAAARKPAFAVGLAALFCIGAEFWQETRSNQEQTIQRTFRSRRGRKQDSLFDSVWQEAAC